MAKDTKERAKRNAVKAIEYACGRRVGEPEYITNLFIQMATEQEAIGDTELAKLKKELLLATTFAVKAKEKEIVDKACKCFCDVCGCKECVKRNVVCTEYKEFRKAMEE